MTIGDVNSTERGSGARFNDGKPPVDLLLWREVADLLPPVGDDEARRAMLQLGAFQETHNPESLKQLLAILYRGDWVRAMLDGSLVFGFGAKKYAAWNWAKGMEWHIPVASTGRHLLAIYNGEEEDPESNLPHRGHVVCNVMMLSAYRRLFPEGNTLPTFGLTAKSQKQSLNEAAVALERSEVGPNAAVEGADDDDSQVYDNSVEAMLRRYKEMREKVWPEPAQQPVWVLPSQPHFPPFREWWHEPLAPMPQPQIWMGVDPAAIARPDVVAGYSPPPFGTVDVVNRWSPEQAQADFERRIGE